jgi:hypothetical protein
MSRIAATLALLVVVLGVPPGGAYAASPAPEPTETVLRSETRAMPSLGLTLLAGLALPACKGSYPCYGAFGTAPSLQALILYQPNESWAFGLVGQVERIHWEATEHSMIDGTPYRAESDVTWGFAGLAARFVPLPAIFLTPVVQLAVGWTFQQMGQPYGCSHGARPAAQLAVGGRARVSSSAFVFAMASARGAVTDGCLVFDAPNTPLAAWGFGFHAGAAFDIALGHTGPATPIAAP